ncbi:hypothetical protein ALC57_05794 [Trachymyrmex cornetzi]|uniref:Uncharacterized protein n=1 Tax=Trachymyrmex cornetzi TaxID=471704 RepID=A0A151J9X5_9HYME|nr:hypothetical protein ALC57_05794 [Trachymyrmex cornetzi]
MVRITHQDEYYENGLSVVCTGKVSVGKHVNGARAKDKSRRLYLKDEAEEQDDEVLSVPEKFLCKRQTYEMHALAKSPFCRELLSA